MMITLIDETTEVEVVLDLEFGPNEWWIHGAVPDVWSAAGFPTSGHFSPVDGSPHTIRLNGGGFWSRVTAFLSLSNMRPYESASSFAGTGTFLGTFLQGTDNRVMWSRNHGAPSPLSDIRRTLLRYLDANVPRGGLRSDQGTKFLEISGITNDRLKELWKTGFTTCNSFAGGVARALLPLINLPKGRTWDLGKGKLRLNELNEEVPGCWIPAAKGRYPRPGDFYSRPNRKGTQAMGHVGIVYSVDGEFKSVDGGQDVKPHYALVKWLDNGSVENFNFTGWIDLDIYYYGKPVPRR